MTDRIHSFQIVLEKNIRDDDSEGIINAIRHIRGVADVIPLIADSVSAMAEARAKHEFTMNLFKILDSSK